MKRVTKVCFVLLATAVAGALLFLYLNPGGSAAFPALPSPNGYDDFVTAGNLLSGHTNDALEMDARQLIAFIATNSGSLRLFQLGLSRTCSVHTAEFLTNNPALALDAMALKRLAQFGVAVGRLAELEGRTNDAVAAYLTGMRYGNEISRGGLIIHRLMGIAFEWIARTRLMTVATNLNATDTQGIILALEKLDAQAVTWAEIYDNERLFIRGASRQLFKNPIMLVQSWWSLQPILKKAKAKHLNETARRRLLIIELALRCHSTTHGSPPQQLGELVPEYLPRVPLDPFTERALSYRLSSTNWLLYSVGADRVDDGGNPRSDVRSDIP